MNDNLPGDMFRRMELARQLRRLADLVDDVPGLTPAVGRTPWIEFHVASETEVNTVARRIGQFPQQFKDQYFVDLDAVELRVRWTHTLPAEPEISDTDPLGLGDGFDRSQTADVDETPVPVDSRRYDPHAATLLSGIADDGHKDGAPSKPVDETGGYWDPSVTSVPAADYTAGGDL